MTFEPETLESQSLKRLGF